MLPKAAATLALLGLLFFALRPLLREAAGALPLLTRVRPGALTDAVLFQMLVYGCVAAILRVGLRASRGTAGGERETVPGCFALARAGAVFLWVNRAVPGPAVSGLAALTMLLGRGGGVEAPRAQAAAATFYLADYAAFVVLALVALVLLGAGKDWGTIHPIPLGAALTLIVSGTALAVFALRRTPRVARIIAGAARRAACLLRHPHPAVWGEAVTGFAERWRAVSARPGPVCAATAWGLVMHGAEVATLAAACRAFGANAPAGALAAGYVAANLAAIVSMLPGGAGLFEGALVGALHARGGVALAPALAATLLYRLLSVWLPVPFGLSALRAAAAGRRPKKRGVSGTNDKTCAP